MRIILAFIAIGLTLLAPASLRAEDLANGGPGNNWRSRAQPGDALGDGKPLGKVGQVQVKEFFRTPGDQSRDFTATIFTLEPGTFDARIVDQPVADTATAPTLKATRLRENAFLVINGGYFDAAFQPDGWCRVAGKEIRPASDKSIYSGLVVGERGKGFELIRYHYQKDAVPPIAPGADILQAGPFLIDPGGWRGVRREGGPKTPRTVLAQAKTKSGPVQVVIITTPVTLYELAEALADPTAWGMEIDRALNLDGGPSTGFSVSAAGIEREQPSVTPVRNHVAFVVRER